MSGRVYLGIDPGVSESAPGAIALIDADGRMLDLQDMPAVAREVSFLALLDILKYARNFGEARCAVENQQTYPTDGLSSAFRTGHNFGLLKGALYAADISFEHPSAAKWKLQMGLSRDKDAGRLKAIQMWPEAANQLKFKKNHGRAEALLIAEWMRRQEGKRRGQAGGD